MSSLPILYIKPTCPWCVEAIGYLDKNNIAYRRVDITTDAEGAADMKRKSNQSKVPTLDWNGTILADFGVDELVPFLSKQA